MESGPTPESFKTLLAIYIFFNGESNGKGKVNPREEERLVEAHRIEEEQLAFENEPIPQDFLAALQRDYYGANDPFWGTKITCTHTQIF